MEMMPQRQMEWLLPMSFELEVAARDIPDVVADPEDDRHGGLLETLHSLSYQYPHLAYLSPETPTVEDLRQCLYDVHDHWGVAPERVFVDHLSLIRGARDYQGVTQAAADLHFLAQQENIALYVAQQTGRGGQDIGRNDGHVPVTLSSGIYAGEHDADWVFGLYRPERNPKFAKKVHDCKSVTEFENIQAELRQVSGLVVLQCIKNRPYGETLEQGIEFTYRRYSRRYVELGDWNR
jgi:hypothetical protein